MRLLAPLLAAMVLAAAALAAPAALADSHEDASAGNETATSDGNATTTDTDAPPDANATTDGDAANATGDDGANGTDLHAVTPLIDLGFTECTDGQSVPRVVADGVGGGPAVIDYVDALCRPPVEAQTGNVGLDFGGRVILLLMLLIALGIALAVYVRKSYVP